MRIRFAIGLVVSCAAFGQSFAQPSEVAVSTPAPSPVFGRLLRPFHLERRMVAPARLTNSSRLESLIRGGNLYLTVQDAIALALENNLDIAIQRYGPFMANEGLRRTQGGQLLRQDFALPLVPGPVSVSPIGVSGNASGVAAGGAIAGSAVLVGFGPNPPSLDPSFYAQAQFGHYSTPQTNLSLNQTTALVQDQRSYVVGFQQQFLTGTSINASYFSQRVASNSPSLTLNPYITSDIDFTISQPLLQGFSRAVNNRQILIAKNNIKVTNLTVKLQVITTVSAILNLYWDLVSFNDDVRIKEQTLATAQRLYEDNQKRVQAGALPPVEVTRAAAQVSASQEALLISRTNLAQQETVLKNALSRTGVQDAEYDAVHIVPLDHIEVPKTDEIQPIQDLIHTAVINRAEIEQSRINLENSKLNLTGSKAELLPTLSAFAEVTNNALAGLTNPIYNNCCGAATPYFTGSEGTALAQLFRRNFPNYSAGFSFNIPLRNRGAQADYAMDQLKLRTEELQLQRSLNQIRVDVKNAVIGLQQARVRYETAVNTRVLAEQSLQSEQQRFQFGAVGSDVTTVIQAQQDLANDQDLEVQAMASYIHARIDFDQALGQTMERNNIKMDEALSGRVARPSFIPDSVPGERK
ncbi:MAG: TolC family protein [Bryobacteraceae bacterium]|jgi:outer membrane protein